MEANSKTHIFVLMESFKLIKPSLALAPYIHYYWILQMDAITPVTERIIPVGCIHLTFHKGKRLFSSSLAELQPQTFVSGHSGTYSDVTSTGNIHMIDVVFRPYTPKLFFQTPVNLFYNANISVDDLEDIALSDLSKQVSDLPDDDQCIQLIESFLLKRMYSCPEYNLKRMSAAIHEINQNPESDITGLAETCCLSNKQFNRIFTEYIGTHPKEFIRIIRLQRALYTLQNQPTINFAQLAYECGFYDQSHFIKEFKTFSGYTPGEYLSLCAPYSDYFSEF